MALWGTECYLLGRRKGLTRAENGDFADALFLMQLRRAVLLVC